jgi:N-acyl-D-amino-acid deacylase
MSFLIKNALVVDGSGAPGINADVLVEKDKIAGFGINLSAAYGVEVIDADGMVLSPGFIDVHSHSDMAILAAPEALGKISQGITTEIVGNCGLSLFPVTKFNHEHLEDLYKNYGEKVTWHTIEEYSALVNHCQPAVNIASLCGHNTLRAAVAGYELEQLSGKQILKMEELLSSSIQGGATGFSSGLLYVPGKFASGDELVRLLKVLSKFHVQYATHLRSEGNMLIEAIEETISSCIAAEQKMLHISHFKAAGQRNWFKIDQAIATLENAQFKMDRISADCYPYTESMTQLSTIAPVPYDNLDDAALMKALADHKNFKKCADFLVSLPQERWKNIRLVSTGIDKLRQYCGKTFSEIRSLTKIPEWQLAAELLRDDAINTSAAFMGMSSEIVRRIAMLPYTVCGTDESARPQDYRIGRSHPRGFGAFPSFFQMNCKHLPLETVIHKMTGMPADIFKIKGRGYIGTGACADLTLFSPEQYTSDADFTNPHSVCKGVKSVWVNGKLAYDIQQSVSGRYGKFLKIFS